MQMKLSDLALGILVTVIWGSNFSIIEMGLKHLDPFLLTALRFLFSALPLVFFLRFPRDVGIGKIAAYGVIFGVGLWWVVNVAMYKGMSPGLSSLILQFSAFFTILLSARVFRERISGPQWIGMGVSLIGLLMIIHFTAGTATILGVALVLLAAISWSVCNILVKKSKPADMMAFVAWSSLFSAPVLFMLTYMSEGARPFRELAGNFNGAAAFSVFFQAYVTTIFGYMVWNNLMKKYPAAWVAPLSLIVPVSGLLTSYLMFDEVLQPPMWLAIVVVLAGLALFVNAGRLSLLFTRGRVA